MVEDVYILVTSNLETTYRTVVVESFKNYVGPPPPLPNSYTRGVVKNADARYIHVDLNIITDCI